MNRNLCKLILFVSFFLLVNSKIFSMPLFDNHGKINSITTEHFKIYFKNKDLKFARRVEKNCEVALEQINDIFNVDWSPKNYPIVITGDIRELNAYYTPSSSDRIVLYNTLPEEGELNNFDDLEYSIFLHELTHAFTLGNKVPAMSFFSYIIGDVFNNSVQMNHGITEGYAVMVESLSGAGRANDVFAMNSILQGVRERNLYGYRRMSGALRNKYPGGKSAYVLMGSFLKYVYDKYGKEKMAEMTAKMPAYVSIKSCFSNVYGISLDTAFDNFQASFNLPKVLASFQLINEASRYTQLIKNQDSLYFTDRLLGTVFKYNEQGISKFIDSRYIKKFNFSDDGKLFGLIEYVNDIPVLRIYDVFKSGRKLSASINNVYDFAFVETDRKYCLALYRYDGSDKYIEFLDIVSLEEIGRLPIDIKKQLYSLVQFRSGKIAFFVRHDGLNYINIYDVKENKLFEIKDEKGLAKRNLYYDFENDVLVFSYAERTLNPSQVHFPRLGMVSVDEEKRKGDYKLCLEDVDGGVFWPVLKGQNLIFIGEGYKQDRVKYAQLEQFTFDEYASEIIEIDNQGLKNDDTSVDVEESKIGGYCPFVRAFPFATGVTLLPDLGTDEGSRYYGLSVNTQEYTNLFFSDLSLNYMHPSVKGRDKQHIALNYIHAFQTRDLVLSLGVKPFLKFDNSVTDAKLHFDMTATFSAIWKKVFDYNKYLELSGNINYDLPLYESNIYLYDSIGVNFGILYSDTVNKGYGFRNTSGFATQLRVRMNDVNAHFKNSNFLFFPIAEFNTRLYLSKLIPVDNMRNLTISFPTYIDLFARYKYSPFDKNAKISEHAIEVNLSANILLFSVDLSEYLFDVPFVVNAFSIEFIPRVSYLNFQNDPVNNGTIYRGIMCDFNILAYFRLTPTFLGSYFTSISFDIGIKNYIGQDSIGDGFVYRPYFYLAVSGISLFGNYRDKWL